MVVSEMEDMVVSAGKGMSAGREGNVLRIWDLATCQAGALTSSCLSHIWKGYSSPTVCLVFDSAAALACRVPDNVTFSNPSTKH